MLHEVLLALSGHPSPLFDEQTASNQDDFPLSPSERALLQSLARLSTLHRQLKEHAAWLANHHQSTVCRAVANSIRSTHLDRFQRKILDVESGILTRDSSIVGAYDIVPLSGVAAEFDPWHRRMEWYWQTTCFIAPPRTGSSPTSHQAATGASLIDYLRDEALTGYPDVEEVAIELCRVADTAWLRQVTGWIIYGRLPKFGAQDFFVKTESEPDGNISFRKQKSLLPKYVSSSTSSSILFVGKSLHQLRERGDRDVSATARGLTGSQLAASHLVILSALSLPLNSSHLTDAVSSIRLSLSQNIFQHLLPLDKVITLFAALRSYFLLQDGEFAVCLVTEAENRLQARWQTMGKLLQQDPVNALRGLTIKDAETSQTLAQAWKRLASVDGEADDPAFQFARKHVALAAPKHVGSRPSSSADSFADVGPQLALVAFNDLLFPSATTLSLTIPSPLDLVISPQDADVYSAINSYLLAMRRSHLRLSELWRKTPARREHPAPPPPSFSSDPVGRSKLSEARHRAGTRAVAARKIWATCSAAIFFLAETVAYFEGEIIESSWHHFDTWLRAAQGGTQVQGGNEAGAAPATRDPETLASAHRAFLSSLSYALLLNEQSYCKELRSLLGNIDHLIAFFNRLFEVQQKLDLDHDAGISQEDSLYSEDERKIALELDHARKRVDSDLQSVLNKLRLIDEDRLGGARFWHGRGRAEHEGPTEFVPWRDTGGVDHLLMKLDAGRVGAEGSSLL